MARPRLEPTVTIGGAPAGYKPVSRLEPTVTIGGAPAGYKPTVSQQPTVTIGGAPAGYTETVAPNYITGAGVFGVDPKAKEVQQNTPPPPVNNTAPDRTLAIETFRNTLALFFGKDEVQKPWVSALYGVTSKYYTTGSTIDEAINLSVQDARNDPALKTFADRFKGIYALQDRLVKGEAIQVPTVAEYFKTESKMGDVLRDAGMGELANQEFLGGVLGLGKSVLEVTNLIDNTFKAINDAPAALKKDLDSFLNLGVSKTDIAKALLTGKDGATALNKKITEISTLSAAKSQGVTIDMATAADIAARGYDYNKSLTGFADVKRLERGQMLGKISGIDFTQKDAIAAEFESSVTAQDKIAKIGEEEVNRFSGRSGRLQSQNRAQGLI